MDLFVTRVSDFIIKDIDTLRFDIINHILHEETIPEEHRSYSMRGETGYHSRDDLCNRNEQWSKDLKLLLHAMIQEHAVSQDRAIPPPEISRINCWGMVMRKGDYSSFHNHPSALFSGVLYLDVPQNLGEKEGQLVFVGTDGAGHLQASLTSGDAHGFIMEVYDTEVLVGLSGLVHYPGYTFLLAL